MLFPHFSSTVADLTRQNPAQRRAAAGRDCGDELGLQPLQMGTQPLSAAPLECPLQVPSTVWFPAAQVQSNGAPEEQHTASSSPELITASASSTDFLNEREGPAASQLCLCALTPVMRQMIELCGMV